MQRREARIVDRGVDRVGRHAPEERFHADDAADAAAQFAFFSQGDEYPQVFMQLAAAREAGGFGLRHAPRFQVRTQAGAGEREQQALLRRAHADRAGNGRARGLKEERGITDAGCIVVVHVPGLSVIGQGAANGLFGEQLDQDPDRHETAGGDAGFFVIAVVVVEIELLDRADEAHVQCRQSPLDVVLEGGIGEIFSVMGQVAGGDDDGSLVDERRDGPGHEGEIGFVQGAENNGYDRVAAFGQRGLQKGQLVFQGVLEDHGVAIAAKKFFCGQGPAGRGVHRHGPERRGVRLMVENAGAVKSKAVRGAEQDDAADVLPVPQVTVGAGGARARISETGVGGDQAADNAGFFRGRNPGEKTFEHFLQLQRVGGIPGAGVQEGADIVGRHDHYWQKQEKENNSAFHGVPL